jgi:hypothetical protein
MKTKMTRTDRRHYRRITRYGNPQSAHFQRWMANRDWSLGEVADGLERLANALLERPGQIGLPGGGYAYYPADVTLTRWLASDGSDFKADLLTIVLSYVGTPDENPLDDFVWGEPAEELLIRRRVDQEGYEGGQMKGDWR